MNSVNLTGRFTRDPDVRYTDGGSTIARFSLAVDRRFKTENGPQADFVNCVAFGKTAEFIEKWFRKGMKMELSGRIQTGSYTNQEGQKIYTTDVVAEQVGFRRVGVLRKEVKAIVRWTMKEGSDLRIRMDS